MTSVRKCRDRLRHEEAGRGPLAGPVVAAGRGTSERLYDLPANDSKKLSEKGREELFLENQEKALPTDWNCKPGG